VNSLIQNVKIGIGSQLRNIQLSRQVKKAYAAIRTLTASDRKKVFIFAQGRSGSSVLESLVGANPEFRMHGELLNIRHAPWRKKLDSPWNYIEGLSRIHADQHFVCHIKIDHLDQHQVDNPTEFISSIPDDWSIIHLYRENIVLYALSTFIADRRKTYHARDEKIDLEQISVDLRFFQKLAKGRLETRQRELDILSDRECLTLRYEKDLVGKDAQQDTVNRIAAYIGLEPWEAKTSLRKINTTKLSDLIINYDEFKACVVENGWESMIEGK
jgi:hypothetical protein